jgi:hypothetical protein
MPDEGWTALPLASRRVTSLPPEPLRLGVIESAFKWERAHEDGRRALLQAAVAATLRRLRLQIGTQ